MSFDVPSQSSSSYLPTSAQLNRFIQEDRHQHYLLYSVTPVFFLHALWLAFVLRVIRRFAPLPRRLQ